MLRLSQSCISPSWDQIMIPSTCQQSNPGLTVPIPATLTKWTMFPTLLSQLHSYTIPIPKSHRLKHKSVTCFHFFFLGSYISTAVKVAGGEYSSLAVRPPNTYSNPLLTATDSPALGLSIGVTSVHWLVSRSNLSTLAKAPSDSLEPPVDKAVK